MRNRYLDLLRAAAIVRVIVYHLFGWPWLSILLPAMGIMFALAGSLTAASLDRRSAAQVITSRLRRLLPPLWLLAVVAVPAMLYLGWAEENGGDEPLSWKLGLWLLPIGDPPGSAKGIDVWEPLWYVRAYLWFVMLSPPLYLAYRKIGWAAVAAPLVLIAVLDKTGFALPFGRADAAMWDFATYGACWIAGFAHHDGRLARIRPGLVVAAAAIMGLAALYWLRGNASDSGWDLNDVSESQALWSLAFVLLALRWQPDMSWLSRQPRLDSAVTLLNNRAVTIYLWHNIAIAAIWPVLTVLALDDLGDLDGPADLIASLGLTLAAVLAFGWAEDLAARRKPALWPARTGDRRRGDGPSPAAPAGGDTHSPMPDSVKAGGTGAGGSRAGGTGVAFEGSDYGDFASRSTGDLRGSGEPQPPGFANGPGVAGGPAIAGGPGIEGRSGFESRSRVDDGRGFDNGSGSGSGPGFERSGGFPAEPGVGDARKTPWAPAGAAPVVMGDKGGFPSRRRDYVAPFPEAEVSFGLPDARTSFGGDREDRDDRPAVARHAVRPPGSAGPGVSGPGVSGPGVSRPEVSGSGWSGSGPSRPRGSASGSSDGDWSEPESALEGRHDPDDHAAAGSWFGGEHDEPR